MTVRRLVQPMIFSGTPQVLDVILYLARLAREERLAARFGYGESFSPINRIHILTEESYLGALGDNESAMKLAINGEVNAAIAMPIAVRVYRGSSIFAFVDPYGADPLLVCCR